MDSEKNIDVLLEKIKYVDYMNIGEILKLANKIDKIKLKNKISVKIAIISSYSIQHLVKTLKVILLANNINAEIYVGKYDGINMEILDNNSNLYKFNPDVVLILTNYTDIKVFPNLFDNNEKIMEYLSNDIKYYKSIWDKLSRNKCHIFQTNFAIPIERELGNLESNYFFSKRNYYNLLNIGLLKERRNNVNIIDVEYLSEYVEKKNWFDYGSYYLAKLGFNIEYLGLFVKIIIDQINAVIGNIKNV